MLLFRPLVVSLGVIPSAPSRPYVGGGRYPRWMNRGGAVTWPPGVCCGIARRKGADLKIGGVAAESGYCVCRLLILHCTSPKIIYYCRSHAATSPYNMHTVQGNRATVESLWRVPYVWRTSIWVDFLFLRSEGTTCRSTEGTSVLHLEGLGVNGEPPVGWVFLSSMWKA